MRRKKSRGYFIPLMLVILLLVAAAITMIYILHKGEASSAQTGVTISGERITFELKDRNEFYFSSSHEENIVTDQSTGYAYVNNELILTTEPSVSRTDVEKAVGAHGGQIIGANSISHTYQIRFDKAYTHAELEKIAEDLNTDLLLADSVPNYVISVEPEDYPDDSEWAEEWGETPSGKNWGVEAIRAQKMWDVYESADVAAINVGVLDNQFYIDHEDIEFEDTFLNSFDPETKSMIHGTHVSGTIAALYNNGRGIAGIAPKVNLYGASMLGLADRAVKTDAFGMTVMEYEAGLVYLICLRECKVINLSYGGGKGEPIRHIESTLRSLIDEGFDFIISKGAGNDRVNYLDYDLFSDFSDPEVLARIITVGAAELDDDGNIHVAEYSNYGDNVDLIAPGSLIYSTTCSDRSAQWGCHWGWLYSSYGFDSGTSMATPHVSGVAAAIWSIRPELTGSQVKEIICNTAGGAYTYERKETLQTVTIDGKSYTIPESGSLGEEYGYTYPMLDAYAAIQAAAEWGKEKELVDVDVNSMPESLEEFLLHFNFGYYTENRDKEFDCRKLDNIFHTFVTRIVTPASIVNAQLYPGEKIKEEWNARDPLDMYSAGEGYIAYPKDKTLWIMENVFNIPKADATSMLSLSLSQASYLYEYDDHGITYLYSILGGIGGPSYQITYNSIKYDGEKYYINYNYHLDPRFAPKDYYESYDYYAEVTLKETDGLQYWSLYRHSEKIPEWLG